MTILNNMTDIDLESINIEVKYFYESQIAKKT